MFNLLSPHDALKANKASSNIPENRPNFPTTAVFLRKISMNFFYQYLAIFSNFLPTSTHLHPPQVENCDSNSQLVVDENDNGKFRLKRVKRQYLHIFDPKLSKYY